MKSANRALLFRSHRHCSKHSENTVETGRSFILSVLTRSNSKKFPENKMDRALQLVHEIEKNFLHKTDEEELEIEIVDEFMHKIRKAVVEVRRRRLDFWYVRKRTSEFFSRSEWPPSRSSAVSMRSSPSAN